MTKGLDLTRVSSKGQIVVPLHIREKLEVAEGDTFAIYEHKGLLVLKKLTHPLGKEDVQALTEIAVKTGTSVHRDTTFSKPNYIH